jgi:hypothetical protein
MTCEPALRRLGHRVAIGIAGADLVSRLERSGLAARGLTPAPAFEPSTHEGQLFPAGGSNPGGASGRAERRRAERRRATGTRIADQCRASVAPPCRGCLPRCRGQTSFAWAVVRAFPPGLPPRYLRRRGGLTAAARVRTSSAGFGQDPQTVTGSPGLPRTRATLPPRYPRRCGGLTAVARVRTSRPGFGQDPQTVTGSPGPVGGLGLAWRGQTPPGRARPRLVWSDSCGAVVALPPLGGFERPGRVSGRPSDGYWLAGSRFAHEPMACGKWSRQSGSRSRLSAASSE